MQLDFKLKKMKEMKKKTFYALSAFSRSSGIVNKCLVSEYFCLSSTMSRYFFFLPQLVFSFRKRVNCIVDSTVSSVYETIEILIIFPLLIIDFFPKWLYVHAQILAAVFLPLVN